MHVIEFFEIRQLSCIESVSCQLYFQLEVSVKSVLSEVKKRFLKSTFNH